MKTLKCKKSALVILIIMLSSLILVACKKEDSPLDEITELDYLTGKHYVEIEIKDYGTIEVELDADVAPISVTNFLELATMNFYDDLNFHRIIPGFMIQGGDPEGTGAGNSGRHIKGEFTSNGVENDLSHTRGAISMARSDNPDSGSSQFFIVHEDSEYLDGSYAVFGYVTKGIEVVDQICGNTAIEDQNGTVIKANQPIIKSIKILTK